MNQKPIQTLVIVSLIALTLSAFWIFLIYKTESLKSQADAIEKNIIAKNNQSTYLNSVRIALKNTQNDLSVIDSHFIDKDGIPEFIDMIESRAQNLGIKLDLGTLDIAAGDQNINTLRIRMNSSGNWLSLMKFVSYIETLASAIRIEQMTLTHGDPTGTLWNMNIEVTQRLKN